MTAAPRVPSLPGYCVLLVDRPGVDLLTDLPKPERLAPRHDELRQRIVTELARLGAAPA